MGSFDLSRQMSLLRAATTTRIDEARSPANITALKGETALLVCTVLNVGDKSVSLTFLSYSSLGGQTVKYKKVNCCVGFCK